MSTTLLAESIRRHFPTRSGELVVLDNVSMTLSAGESVAIMGPSGSGKSTLLNILGTLDTPSAGRVTIEGVDPFTLTQRELARFRNRSIGFIFQQHHLLAHCSALENVLLPTLAGWGGDGDIERARQLLDRVGLSDRLDHRPAELSGGERQRVAIARALINRPVLLLADEPTGNLDGKTADSVANLLVDVHRDENAALVVVTHSERLARRFAARLTLLEGTLAPR